MSTQDSAASSAPLVANNQGFVLDKVGPRLAIDPGYEESLTAAQRENLNALDESLHGLWGLGRNVVLIWCPCGRALDLLVVPLYAPASFIATYSSVPSLRPASLRDCSVAGESSELFIRNLITGTRRVDASLFRQVARLLRGETVRVYLPNTSPAAQLSERLIDKILKRYSISYVHNRAVGLFDIVGFSLLKPFDQMTQLSSLAYSINAAHSKMLRKKIHINFTRSTTGDGFYIWNRDAGPQANINLYQFMHLVLADNAIARQKARANTTPLLKTAFHVGEVYEFYQSEGLHPTMYNYIVGEVTIDLARMVDSALPAQVLVGDFRTQMPEQTGATGRLVDTDAVGFSEKLQDTLSNLHGVALAGEEIASIKCYLTGERAGKNQFEVSRYRITDKHGIRRYVYNAKINIYRRKGDPIFLGLQEPEATGPSIERVGLYRRLYGTTAPGAVRAP